MGEGLFDEVERRRHAAGVEDAPEGDPAESTGEPDGLDVAESTGGPEGLEPGDPSGGPDGLDVANSPPDPQGLDSDDDVPAPAADAAPDVGVDGDHDLDVVPEALLGASEPVADPTRDPARPMRVVIEPAVQQPAAGRPARTAPPGMPSVAVAAGGRGTVPPFDASIRRWDHTAAVVDGTRRPEPLDQRATVDVAADDEASTRPPWWEWPVMVVMALVLAFLLRTFVVQIFWIPSGSMEDTLQVNDRIAIEKVTTRFGGVDRGDVVVFASDEPLPMPDGTVARVGTRVGQFLGVVPIDAQDFVKRIIGLPGDSITIRDGVVSVNGVELDEEGYAQLDSSNGQWDVPAGKLFVMGDNRAHSNDSRAGLGFIDEEDVLGRAVLKIWPFDRFGSVEGVQWDEIPDAG